MKTSNSSPLKDSAPFDFWPLLVCTAFCFFVVTGGLVLPSRLVVWSHSAVAALLSGIAIARLRSGFPSRRAQFSSAIIFLILVLLLVQTLPLPPAVWQFLPARGEMTSPLHVLLKMEPTWMPLSFNAQQTLQSGLSTLPAISLFLAVLTFKTADTFKLVVAVISMAFAGFALALLQKVFGVDSLLNFYGLTADRVGGFYGNKNFFAAQSFTALPIIAVLGIYVHERARIAGWMVAIIAFLGCALLVAGLALAGSRMGLILGMVSVLLTVGLVASTWNSGGFGGRTSGLTLGAVLVSLFIIGQTSMVGLLRISAVDPLTEYRATMFQVSLKALSNTFPAGSGFGTFVDVYQFHEQPIDMIDNYANTAHNDWLQVALEGGAPGVILMALFMAWFLITTVIVWRNRDAKGNGPAAKAFSLVVLLLLVHSIVDFPMRTPALMCLFAIACATMCLSLTRDSGPKKPKATPQPPSGRSPQSQPRTPGRWGKSLQ